MSATNGLALARIEGRRVVPETREARAAGREVEMSAGERGMWSSMDGEAARLLQIVAEMRKKEEEGEEKGLGLYIPSTFVPGPVMPRYKCAFRFAP
jgi:hypothetical protein